MAEVTFPIRFPQLKAVEVVVIRLDDGTHVARTREELEREKPTPKEGTR